MSSKGAQIGKKLSLGFIETVIHVCVYIVVFFLFIKVATIGYDFAYQVFGDPVMSEYNEETVKFTVYEGEIAQDVADELERMELVKYSLALRIRAKLSKLEDKIVPGTYELSQSMTSDQILGILTSGTVARVDNSSALLGENASGSIPEATETETTEENTGE